MKQDSLIICDETFNIAALGRRYPSVTPFASVQETVVIFFFNLCNWTFGTAATTGLLNQPRMIGEGDCGEIGGIKIGRGNRSTGRKPAPAPLCPPQIPHD
jgi:hypothetical protein